MLILRAKSGMPVAFADFEVSRTSCQESFICYFILEIIGMVY